MIKCRCDDVGEWCPVHGTPTDFIVPPPSRPPAREPSENAVDAGWRAFMQSIGTGPRTQPLDSHVRAALQAAYAVDFPALGSEGQRETEAGIGLPRYGVTWDGTPGQPLLTLRPDGYWTPWHLAVAALRSASPCVTNPACRCVTWTAGGVTSIDSEDCPLHAMSASPAPSAAREAFGRLEKQLRYSRDDLDNSYVDIVSVSSLKEAMATLRRYLSPEKGVK